MIILYERFASKENIEKKLFELDLAVHERDHLRQLLTKIYQQHLLAGILDLLASEDRPAFLEKFYFGTEEQVVEFLKETIQDLDSKIALLVNQLELEIFAMIESRQA